MLLALARERGTRMQEQNREDAGSSCKIFNVLPEHHCASRQRARLHVRRSGLISWQLQRILKLSAMSSESSTNKRTSRTASFPALLQPLSVVKQARTGQHSFKFYWCAIVARKSSHRPKRHSTAEGCIRMCLVCKKWLAQPSRTLESYPTVTGIVAIMLHCRLWDRHAGV